MFCWITSKKRKSSDDYVLQFVFFPSPPPPPSLSFPLNTASCLHVSSCLVLLVSSVNLIIRINCWKFRKMVTNIPKFLVKPQK